MHQNLSSSTHVLWFIYFIDSLTAWSDILWILCHQFRVRPACATSIESGQPLQRSRLTRLFTVCLPTQHSYLDIPMAMDCSKCKAREVHLKNSALKGLSCQFHKLPIWFAHSLLTCNNIVTWKALSLCKECVFTEIGNKIWEWLVRNALLLKL